MVAEDIDIPLPGNRWLDESAPNLLIVQCHMQTHGRDCHLRQLASLMIKDAANKLARYLLIINSVARPETYWSNKARWLWLRWFTCCQRDIKFSKRLSTWTKGEHNWARSAWGSRKTGPLRGHPSKESSHQEAGWLSEGKTTSTSHF